MEHCARRFPNLFGTFGAHPSTCKRGGSMMRILWNDYHGLMFSNSARVQ
jgi:hypothetical protein